MTIHTDDMRKFYAHSIANTPVGAHFKDALDEIDRLRTVLRTIAEKADAHSNNTEDHYVFKQFLEIKYAAKRAADGLPATVPDGEVA
jgi:hypothetical protein